MPEPKFDDLLDDEAIETTDDESSALIIKASQARVLAGYWQGRCEALELALAGSEAAHQRAIEQMAAGHELTLAYLKDRLNRLEARHQEKEDRR